MKRDRYLSAADGRDSSHFSIRNIGQRPDT